MDKEIDKPTKDIINKEIDKDNVIKITTLTPGSYSITKGQYTIITPKSHYQNIPTKQ